MNSNNYNCLVKLAAGGAVSKPTQSPSYPLDNTALEQAALARLNPVSRTLPTAPRFAPSAMAPGTSMQAPTPKPPVYPTINPATGGYRVMHRGQPIGPALPGNPNYKFRKDPLPITPYSSGQINLESLQLAQRLADNVRFAGHINDRRKLENAENLDAMFKRLHETNLQRRAAGLPDYAPQAMDLYAPYANSKADYNEADNRIKNDMHLSTIAQEAAMRGTPLNPAEINEVAWWMPNSYDNRTNISNAPEGSRVLYMGLSLPNYPLFSPAGLGATANGVTPR